MYKNIFLLIFYVYDNNYLYIFENKFFLIVKYNKKIKTDVNLLILFQFILFFVGLFVLVFSPENITFFIKL